MNKYGEEPRRGQRVFVLQKDAARAFEALRKAAAEAGFDRELFTLKSAFRTQAQQEKLAAKARQTYGSKAGTWVAQDKSEHLTGRAFDLNLGISNSSANAKSGAFGNLSSFEWLRENAGSFGLNPWSVEPWHWSYNVTR